MSAVAQTLVLDSGVVKVSSMVKSSYWVISSVQVRLFAPGILFVKVIFEMVMSCDLVTIYGMVKLSEQVRFCVKGTSFEVTPGAKVTLSSEMMLFVMETPFGQENICGLETCPYDQEKPCDKGMLFYSVTISVMATCGKESFALRGFSLGSSGGVKGSPFSAWTVSGLDWRHLAETFQCGLSCLNEENHPFPFLYDDHCENERALDFFPPDQPYGLEKMSLNASCYCCLGFC